MTSVLKYTCVQNSRIRLYGSIKGCYSNRYQCLSSSAARPCRPYCLLTKNLKYTQLAADSPHFIHRHFLSTSHHLSQKFYDVDRLRSRTVLTKCSPDAGLTFLSVYTPQYGIDWTKSRSVHTTTVIYAYDKDESKLEKTVKVLKDEAKEKEAAKATVVPPKPPGVAVVPKKSLGQRIVNEVKHYYSGFKLLFIDTRVCVRLLWQILNGKNLTRRERRQLVRTTADLFRLVPFLVFIIVPFMEFLLPVAVKLFPNMLPSTFKEEPKEQEKIRKRLKMKLEMAKFLQDTIEESAIQRKINTDIAAEFAQFIEKVRTSGTITTTEEILKFSKFFEDELTLDNLTRAQLIALSRMLELNTIGTNNFLRFQLRMTLRKLMTDDKMIRKEGIESLTTSELQEACRSRGMRAMGMSEGRLRNQLSQWLELHLEKKIPSSLLLLTRTLYLPEYLSTEAQLKATISSIPETAADKLKVNIQEVVGEKVDNKAKLELIKQEEEAIRADEAEIREQEALEEAKKEAEAKREAEEVVMDTAVKVDLETPDTAPVQRPSPEEVLVDTAPVLEDKAEIVTEKPEEVTKEDLKEIEGALDQLAEEKQFAKEKLELEELKEEVSEYQEDLEELREVILKTGGGTADMKESKSAIRLRKKVTSMIDQLGGQIEKLEKEKDELKLELTEVEEREGEETKDAAKVHQELLKQISMKKNKMVTINELILAMRKMKKIPDSKLQKIADILDEDHDGNIDISHAMKVIELLGKEKVKIDSEQMSALVELLKEEAELEEEEKIREKLEKENSKCEEVKEAQKM